MPSNPVPSDLEIAQAAEMVPIGTIAEKIGLTEDDLDHYGKYMAKVSLKVIDRVKNRKTAKYVDVTAITPTPLGEGKTVTTIGLTQGLCHIGKNAVTCIRQPSLGPVFGIKGGAAGGGYAQVLPMEDFNLHLTGDVHAVGLANNLAAAYLDNSIYKKNPLDIDPFTIQWRRVVDISDRYLRNIVIGLGGEDDGIPRETGFDITVASEVMAILALASDAEDLRKRLGRIVLAMSRDGKPVTTEDIKVAGSMMALLKEAIKPNLLQTLEKGPAFVHAGPFANIAQGNSSIVADRIATKVADYVVTESGFAADMGAEKFLDIKCRVSGLKPDCIVIVCSIRALKMHSGLVNEQPGKPLPKELTVERLDLVQKGAPNLITHVENMRLYGVPVVVAINRFTSDTDKEIDLVRKLCKDAGARAELSDVWAKGGAGGAALAKAVVEACDQPSKFKFLYPDDMPIAEKIRTIATKIYRAKDVAISPEAAKKIKKFTKLGWGGLPICMAKTHLSLSHDPNVKGAPRDFILPVRDIRASVGAGFLYPLCGEMRTMPGLPTEPAGNVVDFVDGKVVGLF